VLCADDEQGVLDGLARTLRSRYRVTTALGGQDALEALRSAEEPFAVVVSDLRMPGMNGVEMLRRARAGYPDTVRVLLTGYADLDAATAAINEGHVFRLLFKPIGPEDLTSALDDAVEQYRLRGAERELLESTLRGSVDALVSTLAIASPTTFARLSRVKALAARLAEVVGSDQVWAVELAAMLSQIGGVALPERVSDKLNRGVALTADDEVELDHLPRLAERVLDPIPRLEVVKAIVRYQRKDFAGGGVPDDAVRGEAIPLGARALRVASDLDQLESAGFAGPEALVVMRGRAGRYDPALLAAAEVLVQGRRSDITAVRVGELAEGMVLAHDLADQAGTLVVGRGFTVTETLVRRLADPAWRERVPGPALVYA
jgi:response regulator RpfG family c-di-GMP phosphodiesterase